jgi:two-component system sensor histidine kinase PilS (NtrC family)
MDLVIKESDRLDRIITDFLEFARLRKPALSAVEVERCLGEVMLLLRHSTALRSEVEMAVECKAPGVRIRADEEQIRQVFLNIMMNACEAMEEGGALTVTVDRIITQLREGESPEECVTISFANDGPAISPETLPHIFEPFYTCKEGGTGLGLAIVARIVESHNGIVRVASSPEGGTVFTVTIPLSTDAAAAAGDEALLEEFISF